MIANALIITIAILLALGFWLMGELKFLDTQNHNAIYSAAGHPALLVSRGGRLPRIEIMVWSAE
jgi:hypothetical protein